MHRPARRDISLTTARQILCARQYAIARWRTRVVESVALFGLARRFPAVPPLPGDRNPGDSSHNAKTQRPCKDRLTDLEIRPRRAVLVRASQNPGERNGPAWLSRSCGDPATQSDGQGGRVRETCGRNGGSVGDRPQRCRPATAREWPAGAERGPCVRLAFGARKPRSIRSAGTAGQTGYGGRGRLRAAFWRISFR